MLEKAILDEIPLSIQRQHRSFSTFPAVSPYLRALGFTLLPSYISRRIKGGDAESSASQKIATLDGLRGIACLIVVNQHLTYNFTEAIFRGWGLDDNNKWLAQVPGISLLWDGRSMVAIFFVISGYVLSHKPLRLMRSQSWEQVNHTIASSAFRRLPRLYIPVMASTLATCMASYLGVFDNARAVKAKPLILTGNEPCPDKFDTLSAQLRQWWGFILEQTRSGRTIPNVLDLHTWTIPVEFMSSMTLFATQMALCRVKPLPRLAVVALLIMFSVNWDWEGNVMFLTGMLLADLDQTLRHNNNGTPADDSTSPSGNRIRLICISLLILGIYLASCPTEHPDITPGYQILTSLAPRLWGNTRPFWKSVGATLIVWVSSRYADIAPLFTNAFAQYLGKVCNISSSMTQDGRL